MAAKLSWVLKLESIIWGLNTRKAHRWNNSTLWTRKLIQTTTKHLWSRICSLICWTRRHLCAWTSKISDSWCPVTTTMSRWRALTSKRNSRAVTTTKRVLAATQAAKSCHLSTLRIDSSQRMGGKAPTSTSLSSWTLRRAKSWGLCWKRHQRLWKTNRSSSRRVSADSTWLPIKNEVNRMTISIY